VLSPSRPPPCRRPHAAPPIAPSSSASWGSRPSKPWAVRFDLLRADAPQTLTLPRPDPADVPALRLQRQTVGGDGER
jgi:hypothetical protein